jgi:translation initiation factor IF-1
VKKNVHETTGTIQKILGNNNYLVDAKLGEKTAPVLCHLSGRIRQYNISIIVGDLVTLEMSPPFDKGRITFRGVKVPREDK